MARIKFTTSLDEQLLQDLKAQALKEKRNVNKILEQIIDIYLKYVNSKSA